MRRFLSLVFFLALFLLALWLNERRHRGTNATQNFTPTAAPAIDLKNVRVLAEMDKEYTLLVESVVPSVVSILTTRTVHVPVSDPFDLLFGRRSQRELLQKQNALGSGMIVSKEGHIITNSHVAAQMDEIKVLLNDGRTEPAQVIATDPQTDLAILKINAPNLKPLPLGDSDQVKVGQLAFAIGNPLGLQETVTRGIISARRRPVDDSTTEFFQTDAAINPGNSGGPLVNLRGEIIGINTWIASQSGGSQGLGFAVPSNVARRVLDGVLKHGRIIYGYLGVAMQPLTPAIAQQLKIDGTDGVLIAGVIQGGPAEKSGLRAADVVKKFNGQPVRNTKEFLNRIASAEAGAQAKLEIIRGGKEMTISVSIGERPAATVAAPQ